MIIKHTASNDSSSSSSIPTSVIPDCCNMGVIYRVLLATNSAVFCGIWMKSNDTPNAVLAFLDSAMVLETISILSLFLLCGLRKMALIQPVSFWFQRLLCGLIPALTAVALSTFIQDQPWISSGFAHASTLQLVVISSFLGVIFQHYFELRNSAFSPALGEARLQALQARIRPHFLFNSINAVLSLIRTEPVQAEKALEDMAELFRVLMKDPRDMSTLADEIKLCRQYLSLEKIRLGNRLNVEWEIINFSEKSIRETQIASLLLQPLLENAVRHGVEPSEKPSFVKIKLKRDAEQVTIDILNPYHGKGNVKGNRIALKNIRDRLQLLYDIEANLEADVVDDQFQVRLNYPLQRTRRKIEMQAV